MVEIEKEYVFQGPDGEASLLDLFEGRLQLIVGHFMFDPAWEEGCPSCSAGADEVSPGLLAHLHARDTTLAYVSRAPLEKLERWKAHKGWTFPWYSSYGSDFNYDFHVTLDESVAPLEYNYRTPAEYERRRAPSRRQPGRVSRHELLPAERRPGLPHLLELRPRGGDDRRLVLLPGPHRARAPGGLGGAERPRGERTRGSARLRRLNRPARQYRAAETMEPYAFPVTGRSGSPMKPEVAAAACASLRMRSMVCAGVRPAQGPALPPLPWHRATAPATWGAAMLVPVMVTVPVFGLVETTQTPGAATTWATSPGATA